MHTADCGGVRRNTGTEPSRSRANSLPGANRPIGLWPIRSLANSFPGPFVPWNFRSLELSLRGPFAPDGQNHYLLWKKFIQRNQSNLASTCMLSSYKSSRSLSHLYLYLIWWVLVLHTKNRIKQCIGCLAYHSGTCRAPMRLNETSSLYAKQCAARRRCCQPSALVNGWSAAEMCRHEHQGNHGQPSNWSVGWRKNRFAYCSHAVIHNME